MCMLQIVLHVLQHRHHHHAHHHHHRRHRHHRSHHLHHRLLRYMSSGSGLSQARAVEVILFLSISYLDSDRLPLKKAHPIVEVCLSFMQPRGFQLSSECQILPAPHVRLGSKYVRLGTSPVTSVKSCNAVACYSARSERRDRLGDDDAFPRNSFHPQEPPPRVNERQTCRASPHTRQSFPRGFQRDGGPRLVVCAQRSHGRRIWRICFRVVTHHGCVA